jgi:hypothetical protein
MNVRNVNQTLRNKKTKTMGYLTTVTIYNDGANQLIKFPERLAEHLYHACQGRQIEEGYNYAGLGCHANLITLQKPRHADDKTLYLHAGNTLVDVSEVKNEWAIEASIKEMEYHLKRLKKLQKETK